MAPGQVTSRYRSVHAEALCVGLQRFRGIVGILDREIDHVPEALQLISKHGCAFRRSDADQVVERRPEPAGDLGEPAPDMRISSNARWT